MYTTEWKIIIAGSRTFTNQGLLLDKVAHRLLNKIQANITVVSGGAQGADKEGEKLAIARGWSILKMPAEWDRYGKSAGYRRNEEMAVVADELIAFWDGNSRGTKHMIDIMMRARKPTHIFFF